jgi:predicted aminopeptidase
MRAAAIAIAISQAGCYYLAQAGGQLDILWHRQPVDEVLKREGLTVRERGKLARVRDAKEFGEAVMGLTKSDNYTTFYDTRGRAVSWVVSACRKERFEQETWWFPIVGTLPYKGYFSADDARREGEALEAKGFDVTVRPVAAYSTLGWFSDPVFSTMLRHDDVDLVALILHELTHGTVFASGHGDWNEALAEFTGREGARQFFAAKHGEESAEAKRAAERFEDEERVDGFMQRVHDRLERLYASGRPAHEILALREQLWAESREEFESFRPTLHAPDERMGEFRGRLNNAELMARRRYGRFDGFRKAFAASGRDWAKFFEAMKKAAASADPFKEMP